MQAGIPVFSQFYIWFELKVLLAGHKLTTHSASQPTYLAHAIYLKDETAIFIQDNSITSNVSCNIFL